MFGGKGKKKEWIKWTNEFILNPFSRKEFGTFIRVYFYSYFFFNLINFWKIAEKRLM